MKVKNFSLKVDTKDAPQLIDITDWVKGCVAESKVSNGMVLVYSRHTTAAVKINENEPLLIEDMAEFPGAHRPPRRVLPPQRLFHPHSQYDRGTSPPNGHAHLQHLMLGCSETIPLIDGKIPFGQWQSIFFIELDHPRPREVMVQIVGE